MVEETISLRVIQEAKEEEREAMSELVRSFQPVLFYIASCHLKSDSLIKATVKTCLAKLFDLLSETEDLSSFNGKAMTMVVRACLNAALTEDRNQNFFPARGSDPKEAEAVYTAADEIPGSCEGITEREAMNVVVRMLGKLPDDQRMIFVMRYLDGMPFARISNMIHIPAEQLEKRAQLAKQALASATGRTVEKVFGIVAHAEQNKYLVIDDRKPEPAVTKAPLPAPAARKSLRPLWITAGVLLAAAAVGTGMWIFRKPEEVSALRYLTASFTGIDGLGTAEITAQESGNKRLDAIIENRSCSLRDADGNEVS
ncbi:MAG: sigma-70 family RNA polymerase sigma factor, partial [Solobacterium sp.]|nr:sigma-70 family RNA polymerase sigma factor [Solobacterium sp.]